MNDKIRFWISAFLMIAVDLAAFFVSIRSGLSWNTAHVISFVPAAAMACVLWRPKNGSTTTGTRCLWTCAIVGMLTLFLRGGLLATLVTVVGSSPRAAIFFTAVLSAAVFLTGLRLQIPSQRVPDTEPDDGERRLTIAFIVYLVLLRLCYGGPFEILFEEGYYWNYAQHLDISYLDHPPVVAWLIWASTTLFGHSEFSVRIGALVCWAVTGYYAYRLTDAVHGARIALRAILLVALLPIFFGFGLVITPDSPLLACWAGALYYLYRSLIGEKRAAWIGVGIFLGLGMLSKYVTALLGGATLLFLMVDSRSRKWLSRPEPYLAFFIVLVLFLPVIVWNAQHDWGSFYFQGPGRLKGKYNFDLPDLIGSILILLTPTGFATAIATVTSRRTVDFDQQTGRGSRTYRLLLTLTIFPLGIFSAFSLFRNIKLSWTGPLWLGILPYMAVFLVSNHRKTTGWVAAWASRAWPATIVVVTLLYGAALHYLVLGFPAVPYPRKALMGMGMEDLARKVDTVVETYERQTGDKPIIVCMDTYRLASWLAFYRTKISGSPSVFEMPEAARNTTGGQLFGKNSMMYRYWHPPETLSNRTILFITDDRKDMQDPYVILLTEPLGEVQKLAVEKNGKNIRTYYYRWLRVKAG
ncbi:MAG: glycosyltransferase family 39 protein [Desulfobacterales bacterium]